MSDYVKYEVRVYSSGSKYWYLNGKQHREDGPAVEHVNGYKSWYLEGVNYSESQHKAEMARRNNTCNGKVVTIEGKQYELTEIKQ
jgi:hypothetical protein